MLSSEDIITELKAKIRNLERTVREFEYITLEPNELGLYKTALHACEYVASDHRTNYNGRTLAIY
jgi:hypothetical protein